MESTHRPATGFFSKCPALRYSLAYAVLSGIWIFSSDRFLAFFVSDPGGIAQLQTFKGLIFIGISAFLLYFIIKNVYTEVPGQSKTETFQQSSARPIVLAVLLFSLAITAGGFALYQSARKEITRNATANLASVAQLKVSQINAWLGDSRLHIEHALTSPGFMAALQSWQKTGENDSTEALFHLQQLATAGRFYRVALYDTDGRLLLSTDAAGSAPRIKVDGAIGEIQLDDFHKTRHGQQEQFEMGLISPVHIAAESKPIAWIHVTLDHNHHLTNLLQQWPGASPSAESLLVRREGNAVVYLNVLRHRAGSPLSLSLPVTTPNLTAGQLILGKRGEISGVDYRQIPVIAYGLAVANTPWFIVAKIDAAEVYANLNMLTAIAIPMLGTLLLIGAWAVAMRQKRLVSIHRGEVERLSLAKRYEVLVKYANDCIFIIDAKHRIIDVNERCQGIYGYSREEMLALTDRDLLPSAGDDSSTALLARSGEQGPLLYEVHHQRKDGSVFPVEISEVIINIDGERQTHKIVRDITERKINEARIAQLSRLSITLSTVNHAIAHSSSLEEVFNIACRTCVVDSGFKLAWVGLAEKDSQQLRIANMWGEGVGFLDGIVIGTRPDTPEGMGPSATAFREQRTCICDDLSTDPMTLPWHDRVAQHGISASVSLPISRDGVPMGVLTAYSDHSNSFDPQSQLLLGEIAEVLSFAMHHFAELAAKRETEEALKRREQQLLKAEELAKLGHWEIDLKSGEKSWSPQMYRLFERDPAQGPAEPEEAYSRYYTSDSARLTEQSVHEAIVTGQRIQLEQELHFPDQRTAYHASVIVPIRNEQDQIIALHGTIQDITEHKASEARLAKMASRLAQAAREYEDLYQHAPCGYHSLDKDGVFQRINRTELDWLGYSHEEMVGKMKFTDLLPPDRVSGFLRNYPRVMETGQLRDLEQYLVCKDGSILPVLINATAIRDESGRFLMSRSTAYNMTERKKIEKERDEYIQRLTQLSRRLVNTQEEERKRLSASLHDRTSPNLAAIGLNLSIISMPGSAAISPDLAERLEDIRALLEDTTASIREISADLRPPLLDYAGLLPALEGYLYQFSKRTGTATHFECSDLTTTLTPELETLLFRITQEALTNCAKHANAKRIDVVLANDNGDISLCITDDGSGFDPGSLGKNGHAIGLGVLNMRELAEFAGGKLSIDTSPGQGTCIRVRI